MKRTMMKLLSVVMALMMLFGSFSAIVSAADVHEHDKTTKLETIGPRCNAYGYTLYVCSCGETWAGDIVAKTEGVHSLQADGTFVAVDAKAPTCTEDGRAAGKLCAWCGEVVEGCEKTADKTEHNMQYVIKDGDCNNVEAIVYKCVNEGCGLTEGGLPLDFDGSCPDLEADGHDFVYVMTKAPTCTLVESKVGTAYRVSTSGVKFETKYVVETTNGEAEYVCVDCGLKFTGIVVEFNGHAAANLAHKTNGLKDTCTTNAAEWDECLVCGFATNYVETNAIDDHDYVRVDYTKAIKLGYPTNYRVATCGQTGLEVKECTRCNNVTAVTTDRLDHVTSYKCDTCAVCTDCTHEGRELICRNFGVNGCNYYVSATKDDHTWSAKKYYSYEGVEKEYDGTTVFCVPMALYSKCTNDGCTAVNDEGSVAGNSATGTHLKDTYIVDSAVVADCTTDGYFFTNCVECLNANVKYEGAAATQRAKTIEAIKTLKFEKLGHITELDQTKTEHAIKVAGTKPTCQATGTEDLYYCGRGCGELLQGDPDKVLEKDPANHTNLSVVLEIEATCTTPAATYKKCDDCGTVVYESNGYDYFNHTKYTIDVNTITITNTVTGEDALVAHEANAVECGVKDGNYAYKTCKFCMAVVSIDKEDGTKTEEDKDSDGVRESTDTIFVKADTVISKAHDFEKVEAKKETCDEDGNNEYYKPCSRCGADAPVSKQVIPAHGDTYATIITSDVAYAPTCLTAGVAAGRYCAECDTIDGVKVADSKKWNYTANPNFEAPKATDPWYLAPLGHESGAHMAALTEIKTLVKGDCVAESFASGLYCTFCVAENIEDLVNAEEGKAVVEGAWVLKGLVNGKDHVFPEAVYEDDEDTDEVEIVNVTKVEGDCTTSTKYYVDCVECGAKHLVKEEAAKGHYYVKDGNEVIIDTSCTAIEGFANWSCAKCGLVVGRDILPTHNVVEVIEPATCDEDGRKYWACADCDAFYFDGADDQTPSGPIGTGSDAAHVTVIPTTGHDFLGFKRDAEGNLAGFKVPTLAEEGYITRVCKRCGDVVTELGKLIPELDIVLDADVEDDTIASGDTFTVDVVYSGDYYEFNALEISVMYNYKALDFVGAENLPAGAVVEADEKNGHITIAIYSLDGVLLQPEEVKSISLTFKAMTTTYDYEPVMVITEATAFDADGEEIDGDYFGINLDYDVEYDEENDKLVFGDAILALEIVTTGELNGFYGINAGDAIVMMDLIYSEEYDSAADLNKDGKVDMADFALLNKVIATDGSDEAYAKLLGYSKLPYEIPEV